jgi:hypothetical protein
MDKPDVREVLRGMYVWELWRDGEWRSKAVIVVSEQVVIDKIEEFFESGDYDLVVLTIAFLLGMYYKVPLDAYIWRNSRVVRLWERPGLEWGELPIFYV